MTINTVQHKKDINTVTKNRIIAPIILGVTIIISIIFTRPLYLTYIDSQSNLSKLKASYNSLASEQETLIAIKNNTSPKNINTSLAKKILERFDRPSIISTVMFNNYTLEGFGVNPKISLGAISVADPARLPNGLSYSVMNVDVQGKTLDQIVEYITYLTTETPYAFTLENISLPIDTSPEGVIPDGFSLGLTLGIYTFED